MTAQASNLMRYSSSPQAIDNIHKYMDAVCQIDTSHPGTGFLIGPHLVLTCCHVLPDEKVAENAYAYFEGTHPPLIRLAVKDFFVRKRYLTNKEGKKVFNAKHLDFALVALKTAAQQVSHVFTLSKDISGFLHQRDQQIHVIQHPLTEVIKKDPETGRVTQVNQLSGEKRIVAGRITCFDHHLIHYNAPAAGGSSGGPVINDQGQLYAFHQGDCQEHPNCYIGVRVDAVFRLVGSRLNDYEEKRQIDHLKNVYLKKNHLELMRPVRKYKDWKIKIPIEKIYRQLTFMQVIQTDESIESPTNISKRETFSQEKFFSTLTNPQKTLIVGPTGAGKSTLCQYVAYLWAKGDTLKEIRAVFWIRLCDILEEDTVDSLVERACGIPGASKKSFFSTGLLILDGQDEMPLFAEKLFRELTEIFSHVILTSRPQPSLPFTADIHLELTGLHITDVSHYAEQYFPALHDQYPKELSLEQANTKKNKLQKVLQDRPLLLNLARLPINASLLCALFSQEDTFLAQYPLITSAILYNYIVNWMYICAQIRFQALKRSSFSRPITSLVSQANPMSDPLIQNIEAVLQEIALKCMTLSRRTLDQENIEEILISLNKGIHIEHFNEIGLFKIENGRGEFIHLSYQYFFVARYLANLYQTAQRSKAQAFIQQFKNNELYQWIFRMTSGLLSMREAESLSQFMSDLIASSTTGLKFESLYNMNVIASCYEECIDPEKSSSYKEFLRQAVEFIKKENSIRFCTPRLLSRQEIVQAIDQCSYEQIQKFISELRAGRREIPDFMLEKICQPQFGKYATNSLMQLEEIVKSWQAIPQKCLEFLCSLLNSEIEAKNQENSVTSSLAFHLLTTIIGKEYSHLDCSLEATMEWLGGLPLTGELQFCLICSSLDKNKNVGQPLDSRSIVTYLAHHDLEGFLNLKNLSLQDILSQLINVITSDKGSTRTQYYAAKLLGGTSNIELKALEWLVQRLVLLLKDSNSYAAQVLRDLAQTDYRLPESAVEAVIEHFEKGTEEDKNLDESNFFTARLLAQLVKRQYPLANRILDTLRKKHCISALKEIARAKTEHAQIAFDYILEDISHYLYFKGESIWVLDDLLAAPFIKEIVEKLFNFPVLKQLESLLPIFLSIARAGFLFSAENIRHFIDLLNDPNQSVACKVLLVDILYKMIENQHPQSPIIVENAKQQLRNQQLGLRVKQNCARILAHERVFSSPLELDILQELVLCIPDWIHEQLPHSIILLSCTSYSSLERPSHDLLMQAETFMQPLLITSILKLILKQPQVRISFPSMQALIDLFKQDKAIDKWGILELLSLLKYQDYQDEAGSRELFRQIANLRGRPFKENS